MMDSGELLRAYDHQLRTEAETVGAAAVSVVGPLWLVTYAGGQGFVSYRDLDGADPVRLVGTALEHFVADPDIERVEWKTRGHDHAPGLHDALAAAGFAAEEPESIMIGEAAALAVEVEVPPDVTVRQVADESDLNAMAKMQDEAFGNSLATAMVDDLARRIAAEDGVELWVAEVGGRVVSAGRLEPVAGTDFAGIWGGSTLPEWRGRGIYRALTAARARSALARGKSLIHSDSTEFSRPILERSGLVQVSTTTPYQWTRPTPRGDQG